jgi:hypothetical protein
MINTNDVAGKLLILRKEYMNAEDLSAIKAFEDQLKTKAATSQKINRTNDQTVLPQRPTDPVIQQARTGENYLTVSGGNSNISAVGQPQTLKLDQKDAIVEDILNKSRTWYNGKLWDINNDGKAEELTIGPISKILQDGKILINPRKTWNGQPDSNNGLILSSKNLTQEDIDFVNMWKKQNEDKKKAKAMSRGGVIYAQYGYDPYGGRTLSLGGQGYEQRPRPKNAGMSKEDKEWDEIQRKAREVYGDDYVDRNYTFDQKNIREWRDSSGKYSTKARLYSTLKNDVALITDKDKKITLPLSRLSDKDIDYVYRMIQYKRRDIKMDKFEAEYNASTGAPGWGYNDAGRPIRKEEYKAPNKIGGYQFDPVTGRVISGSGNFGPRPTRTFRIEDGRVTPISSPNQPLPRFASGIKSAVITDANRAEVISRARAALARNGKRNEITKTSQYYAEKLGFDPSITEAGLYDQLKAQQNPIQPINKKLPGLPVKSNISSPIVKPPVSTASPTVKPPVSTGKYPKADGTRTDELAEADQSIFTTQDLITQANETNRVYVLAAQIAQYRLAEQGINYKTGLPIDTKQKPVTKQNGGLVYAQYGYDPTVGTTLSLGRQGYEQRPRTNTAPNRPGIFGDGRMPSAAGTTPIVSGTKPRVSTVKPERTPPGMFGTGKAPPGLITTSGTKPIILSRDETGRVYRQNEIPVPKTLSLDPKAERVWYGGKLWDQNRDGKESQNEQLIGSLEDIAVDGDVRIIRNKDWGYGRALRLDKRSFARFSTPEDQAIVNAWLSSGKKKSPAAFANGGLVYAQDGLMVGDNQSFTNQYVPKPKKQLFVRMPSGDMKAADFDKYDYKESGYGWDSKPPSLQNKLVPGEQSAYSKKQYKAENSGMPQINRIIDVKPPQDIYEMHPDQEYAKIYKKMPDNLLGIVFDNKGIAYRPPIQESALSVLKIPDYREELYTGAERWFLRNYAGFNDSGHGHYVRGMPQGRMATHRTLSSQIPSGWDQYYRDSMRSMFYDKLKNTQGLMPFQVQETNESMSNSMAFSAGVAGDSAFIRSGQKPENLDLGRMGFNPFTYATPGTVALHELEHQRQDDYIFDKNNPEVLGPPNVSYDWHRMSIMEPPAVLSEMVHAAQGVKHTRATAGRSGALKGTAPLTPNYQPSLEWMVQQAKSHGHIGGDKSMTELLNTPEGQAWLKMQWQDLADTPSRDVNRVKKPKSGSIPMMPTSEEELRDMARKLKEPPKRKKFLSFFANGGLVNYLADGGSAYDRRKNDPITQTLNRPYRVGRPFITRTPYEEIPEGLDKLLGTSNGIIENIINFPSSGVFKPFGVISAALDSISNIGIATTKIGVAGTTLLATRGFKALKGIVGPTTKSGTPGDAAVDAFVETLDEASLNEIERGKLYLASSFGNILQVIDRSIGTNLSTEGMRSIDEKQNELWEQKLAIANKNGVPSEAILASEFGSQVGGQFGVGAIIFRDLAHKFMHLKPLKLKEATEAGQSVQNINRLIQTYNSELSTSQKIFSAAEKPIDKAGQVKDGIENIKKLRETYISEHHNGSHKKSDQVIKKELPLNLETDKYMMAYNKGGPVYASTGKLIDFQSRGTDTVPAMLTPGEFVINRKATQNNLSLLKAINSGSYSHGDIVKKFNRGGVVNPGYYQLGGNVDRSNNFDFGSFMQRLMGQLSSVIGTSLREGLQARNNAQNVQQTSNGVSIDSKTLNSIGELTNRLKSIADTLAGLNGIPSEIKVTGRHDVNVIINGDSVLNKLSPEIQDIVMNEIKNSFNKLVNANKPMPSDKLINPFDLPQS